MILKNDEAHAFLFIALDVSSFSSHKSTHLTVAEIKLINGLSLILTQGEFVYAINYPLLQFLANGVFATFFSLFANVCSINS